MAESLTAAQIAAFLRDGYLVVPAMPGLRPLLDALREDMVAAGRMFVPGFTLQCSPAQIQALESRKRHCLYNAMRLLPAFHALASSHFLVETGRLLGLSMPALHGGAQNIRMDLPSESRFLFDWHQDTTYQLGSANAVTYWLPLGRVDAEHGSVAVVPGSHAAVAPVRFTGEGVPAANRRLFYSDIAILDEPKEDGLIIEADAGDLVVFSQLAMHRSIPNRSKQARWTAIIRHTDIADPDFIAAGYPLGETTNFFHTSYLPGFKPGPGAG